MSLKSSRGIDYRLAIHSTGPCNWNGLLRYDGGILEVSITLNTPDSTICETVFARLRPLDSKLTFSKAYVC